MNGLKKMLTCFIGLSLVAVSCFQSDKEDIRSKRVPSSIDSSQELRDFVIDTAARVEEGTRDPAYCQKELGQAYETLLNMSAQQSGVLDLSSSDWEQLLNLSFHTRLEIKEKLKDLRVNSQEERGCLSAVKNIVRALRYMEDYLLELVYSDGDHKRLQVDDFDSLKGLGPHFHINPEFRSSFESYKDLKSGDIIISRGGAFSSAAIARIGQHDTQFSHLAMVHVDERGEVSTIEAHIEIGSLTAPLQEFLDYRHSRLMVFRHPDQALAKKAADIMYEKVNSALKNGEAVPYDFTMNYQDNSELFCTEVAYEGFYRASDGKIKTPTHPTQFNPGILPFLKMAGLNLNEENVKTFQTFAPGDFQFETEFDLVAEYRNPLKLEDSRLKDAVLTKIFDWMDDHDYRFDPSFKVSSTSYASWILRRTPVIKKFLEKRFPMNMDVNQLRIFMMIEELGEVLQKKIEKIQAQADYPLTPLELYGVLDEYRREDLNRYHTYKKRRRDLQLLRTHRGKSHRSSSFDEERNLREEIRENKPHFHDDYRPGS